MIARLVLSSLADSKTTVEELRRVLRDEVAGDAERVAGDPEVGEEFELEELVERDN